MAKNIIALVGLLTIAALLFTVTNGKLKFVLEVSRHGARSGLHQDLDPWNTSWPQGEGELTNSGMRQHYLIGAQVRKKYTVDEQLLDPVYNLYQVYLRSSDVNRTLQSAESQIAASFPPNNRFSLTAAQSNNAKPPIVLSRDWYEDLGTLVMPENFQPIPIHAFDEETDDVLEEDFCPKIALIQGVLQQSPAVQEAIAGFWISPIPQLEAALGRNLSQYTYAQIDNMVDQIYCDYFDGRAPNITNELMEQLLQMMYQYRKLFRYADPVVRLAFVGFVREITNYFNQVLEDDATSRNEDYRLKFVHFSGHDTNIAIFSAGLKVPLTTQPHFASTMFFELHSNESASSSNPQNNYYVRLIYNDADIDFTEQCGSYYCTLLQFNQLTQSAIFQGDLYKECHSPLAHSQFRGDFSSKASKISTQYLLSAKSEEKCEALEESVSSTIGQVTIAVILVLTAVILVVVLATTIARSKKANKNGGSARERFELDEGPSKSLKRESISLLEVEI